MGVLGLFSSCLYCILITWTSDTITYDATIVDDFGAPICDLRGIDVALHGHRVKALPNRYEVVYRPAGLTLSNHHGAAALSEALQRGVPRDERSSVDTGSGSITPNSLSSNSVSESITETSTPLSSNGETSRSLVLEYVRGQETKIQTVLATLDASETLSLLFIAVDGLDGDASLGFTRALRREYPTWIVRVVTFDPSWTPARRFEASHELATLAGKEVELKVAADGSVLVPRVELAEPPASRVPLSLDYPWSLENGEVLRIDLPLPSPDHIIVQVGGVAWNNAGIWQFAGKIVGTSRPVIGVTTQPISSHIQVHKGTIVQLCSGDASDSNSSHVVPPLLASTVLALVLGLHAFSHPERFKGRSILIHDANEELGAQIRDLCTDLGLEASLIHNLGRAELAPSYLKKPEFIISSTRERKDTIILRSLLASDRGRLLLWNDSEEGLAGIATKDPWMIGDALRSSLQYCNAQKAPPASLLPPSRFIPESVATASLATKLFDPNKSYLLIGGIGSLGLYTALWMYQVNAFEFGAVVSISSSVLLQHGARHLTLTSRSGPSTLDRAGDWVSQRVLHHLRGLSDLTLQAPAVDATSEKDMAAILSNLSAPLGGCVLMAALLNDRIFSSHTQETFDVVFPPKVDAFTVLERVVDLNTLDFVVTYSSISGVFGNAGQTNYAAYVFPLNTPTDD